MVKTIDKICKRTSQDEPIIDSMCKIRDSCESVIFQIHDFPEAIDTGGLIEDEIDDIKSELKKVGGFFRN
jgi:hypothetical protein